MPLVNKQPFKPNPIPDNLSPDDEVFYLELTNEIFTCHDAFFDRFLYCNSLIWSCSRTGKSGLTYEEALKSEQAEPSKKKGKKGKRESTEPNPDGSEPVKKKKKKYPYDPKKYSMPVPEGFDPSLLTPTGKIDGRKLKSKKNKLLAEELLLKTQACQSSGTETPSKKGRKSKKDDEARKKEEESKKKEDDVKKKAQLQAELAKERELEAKRKKEAAALAKQLERQKKEEERKKAAAFLQNWEKKCEDLERDDLRRLPQPTPLNCDIPERLFGDAVFILESLYNLHELYNFTNIFPDGMSYDTLEEVLFEKQEDGPLGIVIQFLLRLIFNTQPTGDGYGLDDDPSNKNATSNVDPHKQHELAKANQVKIEENVDAGDHDHEANGLGSEPDDDDENEDKDVNMNDLIGSAIRAAQEVKKSLSKPLPEMELNTTNMTEILKLHLLQSGSFPKGRTIYNGWYSSREDPGLWLCMQEPDLIKKLGEVTIYDLGIEERIKILHTLIYQLFSFIKTRTYIEAASEQLTELRKKYRSEAAAFARWDRENCVKRMQPPKRKSDQNTTNQTSDKPTDTQVEVKSEHPANSFGLNGDAGESEYGTLTSNGAAIHGDEFSNNNNNQQLKSCLKTNGTSSAPSDVPMNSLDHQDDGAHSKKKITFKTSMNGAIDDDGLEDVEMTDHADDEKVHNGISNEESEQNFEELERAYQQNMVDYEDYQRERAIRNEQLNETLLAIRTNLRSTQSIYGVHPIGRDRGYRRYWLFQSLPGLFVEQDDDYVGQCLPSATPLESRYKKLFNKENPLMHPNEADLIRTKTCDVACSTETASTPGDASPVGDNEESAPPSTVDSEPATTNKASSEVDNDEDRLSGRLNGCELMDDHDDPQEPEPSGITEEMNYCTGDQKTCAVHGLKRPTQPRWWFYHLPESIDSLVDNLNKRGHRESELHDILLAENSNIKPWVAECPAYKLNKFVLEQSGIRRSRRLRTKGSKKRGRNYD